MSIVGSGLKSYFTVVSSLMEESNMEQSLPYPFEEVPIRALLTQNELLIYLQTQIATGSGNPPTGEASTFIARQKTQSSSGTGLPHFDPPDWIREHIAPQRPLEGILDVLQQRVLAKPRESSLREALILINEFARLPGGTALIRTRLTQQVVDQLIEKGEE